MSPSARDKYILDTSQLLVAQLQSGGREEFTCDELPIEHISFDDGAAATGILTPRFQGVKPPTGVSNGYQQRNPK